MNGEYAKCECQSCGSHIEYPVDGAGTTIQCPHCGNPTLLNSAVELGNKSLSTTEVLAGFSGAIRPGGMSFLYQIGLLLVTLVMLLLPVAYVALIMCGGWAVYWYGTHCFFLMQSVRGGIYLYVLKAMVYLGGLFAGGVAVFFMFKPLFARRVKRAEPLALNPAVEKTLFTFIAKICETVGAPMPARIDLDCRLNASASFRKGVLSFLGNDLVLTIGLPMVVGLNTRELAGVITHELGHFRQGLGMRLGYVIGRINQWFFRVVYERDTWDVSLETMAMECEDARISIVIGCARLAVWCSRSVLKGLMFLGHAVSCFLMRQKEYDADTYEIRVAGSRSFESAMVRMSVFAAATNCAYKEMRTVWNVGRQLPDNFPAYLLRAYSKLPEEQQKRIEDNIGFGTTGLFDTHPSVADRIRRARQANEQGVFSLEAPASALFASFDVVSKQVTWLHYADDLGIVFDRAMLKPVGGDGNAPVTSESGEAKARFSVLQR